MCLAPGWVCAFPPSSPFRSWTKVWLRRRQRRRLFSLSFFFPFGSMLKCFGSLTCMHRFLATLPRLSMTTMQLPATPSPGKHSPRSAFVPPCRRNISVPQVRNQRKVTASGPIFHGPPFLQPRLLDHYLPSLSAAATSLLFFPKLCTTLASECNAGTLRFRNPKSERCATAEAYCSSVKPPFARQDQSPPRLQHRR